MRGTMKKILNKKKTKWFYFILCCLLSVVVCSRKTELQKGIEAVKKGDYLKAVQSLKKSLQTDSLAPEVHYNLSLAYAYLDSVDKSFHHYLKLIELDSPLKENTKLKELLARLLNLEPYTTKQIPMNRMNQFKGSINPAKNIIAVAAAKNDIANIYLVNLQGKVIKKITKRAMNTDPCFSPDGKFITFISNLDGDDELFLFNLQTGEIKKLTNNTAKDFSPAFSPDGKEIAFVSNMDDPYKWEIYKLNIESHKIKRLTRNNYWDGFPKFSSDGKYIVFSSKRDGSEQIYQMKSNGGGEKILYESPADDSDPSLIGDNLYFKSERNGKLEVYRYNLRNKELIQLTNNRYPDWNPRLAADGSILLITRKYKKRWRLYLIDFKNAVPSTLLVKKIKIRLESENN